MRLLVVPALAIAVLAAVVAPAAATPPTVRAIPDAVEPGKAYDVVSVTVSAAAAPGRKAKVVVEHARRVAVGDGIDFWVDTDDDRQPDLYLTGFADSEFALYNAHGWAGHGRDISAGGCATLRMVGTRSVIRFDPSCLAPSQRFSVSVRSFVQGQPAGTADQVPGPGRLTKKVLAYAA